MKPATDLLANLIGPLELQFQLSEIAYQKYLRNKIYIHAEALRKSNNRIRKLLSRNGYLLPGELIGEGVLLLNHYDIWMTQFRAHKKKVKPGLSDEFIFEQADAQCAFPAAAVLRFRDYFLKMKNEKSAPVSGNG